MCFDDANRLLLTLNVILAGIHLCRVEFLTLGTPNVISTVSYGYDLSPNINSVTGRPVLMSGDKSVVNVSGVVVSFTAVFTSASPVRLQLWRPSTPPNDSLLVTASDLFFELVYETKFTPTPDQLYSALQINLSSDACHTVAIGDRLGVTVDAGDNVTFAVGYNYTFPVDDDSGCMLSNAAYTDEGNRSMVSKFDSLNYPFQLLLSALIDSDIDYYQPMNSSLATGPPSLSCYKRPVTMTTSASHSSSSAFITSPAGKRTCLSYGDFTAELSVVDSLVGLPGLVGPQGPHGSQGPVGPRGYSGSDGLDGSIGLQGIPGPPGSDFSDIPDDRDAAAAAETGASSSLTSPARQSGLAQLLDGRLVTALVIWLSILTTIIACVLIVMLSPNGIVSRLINESRLPPTTTTTTEPDDSNNDYDTLRFDDIATMRTRSSPHRHSDSESDDDVLPEPRGNVSATIGRKPLPPKGPVGDDATPAWMSALRSENWILLPATQFGTLVSTSRQQAMTHLTDINV